MRQRQEEYQCFMQNLIVEVAISLGVPPHLIGGDRILPLPRERSLIRYQPQE